MKPYVVLKVFLSTIISLSFGLAAAAHGPVPVTLPRLYPKTNEAAPQSDAPQQKNGATIAPGSAETETNPSAKTGDGTQSSEDNIKSRYLHEITGEKCEEGEDGYARAIGTNRPAKVEFVNGKKVYKGSPPCQTWIDPDKEPYAVLLCVHGCGLHSGTYQYFAKRMAKSGVAVYAVDVRGFGSYRRTEAHDDIDFDGCLYDVHQTLNILHKVHPTLPIYLLGESMGGAIALREASLFPNLVSGLISSVPAGNRFKQTSTDLRVAAKFFTGPNRKFDIGTSIIDQATMKPELKKAWSEDPLATMNLSAKELIDFSIFCNGNKKAAKDLKSIPVLFLQGCGDKLIKPISTFEIFDILGTQDKKLIAVQNQEHLIFEEAEFNDPFINDMVGDLVLDWIKRPSPKSEWQGEPAAKLYGKDECPLPAKKDAKKEHVAKVKSKKSKQATAEAKQPESPPTPVNPVNSSTELPAENAIVIKRKSAPSEPGVNDFTNDRPTHSAPVGAPAKNPATEAPAKAPGTDEASANRAADRAAAEAFKKMRQQQQQQPH